VPAVFTDTATILKPASLSADAHQKGIYGTLADITPTILKYFEIEKPEYVVLAAAKVGGIAANLKYRVEAILINLEIQNNVISASHKYDVKKLLFLGSSCIYPKQAPQPIMEDALLTSPLEYTNEPYAIAKIAGIKMIESYNIQYGTNYLAVMPTNLYGPNDNFDLEKSHVFPATIRKMILAKWYAENNIVRLCQDLGVDESG
jgi:GDP-L-fucose synthase